MSKKGGRKAMSSKSVVTEANENVVQVQTREQLINELAAVSLALLDKRDERTKANKKFNADIKDLEKRNRELAQTVKSTGIRDSIQMNFPSATNSAPEDEPDDEVDEGHN